MTAGAARSRAAPDATPSGLSQLGASQRERLDSVLGAGLVERGSVFVLSLEPIRDESGRKWEARKEQIWERVERSFTANLPVEDICMRIDDVSLVVAVASCSAYEGQARCVALLRELMGHFLGRSGNDDIRLSRVSGVRGDELVSDEIDILAPVDPRFRAPPAGAAAPAAAAPVPPEQWSPPLGGRVYAAPFTNMRGDPVEMQLHITPVWCLRRGAISSYAIRRVYPAFQQPRTDHDQEAADMKSALRMVEILKEYQTRGGVFALHAPVYFATAASRRSRVNLLGRCAPVLQIMRQVVIMEIEDVDFGIPQGRLQEAVAMSSPFVRAVMAGVREGERLNPYIRDSGFAGVTIDAGPAAGMPMNLGAMVSRARRLSPNVVVHNVRAADKAEAQLAAAGASHLSSAPDAPID